MCFPLPEPLVSVQDQDPVYCPLREHLGFKHIPFSPRETERPLIFTARCFVGSFSWLVHFLTALVLWVGDPAWGWDPTLLREYFCSQDFPPDSQLPHLGAGASPFHVSMLFFFFNCLSLFYFIFKYICWLCYYSCPISPPSLHPAHPLPPTFHPYSSCPWVIHITSLSSTFPILFLPSPCLFSTYHLCCLFSVHFPPLSPSHSPAI